MSPSMKKKKLSDNDDVESVVDDANDVVEGDDNNRRDDAVNEWDDALKDDNDVEDDDARASCTAESSVDQLETSAGFN
jgi:hypothetical protein